jgi:hypothetical protein
MPGSDELEFRDYIYIPTLTWAHKTI